jgi:hypothetical protein
VGAGYLALTPGAWATTHGAPSATRAPSRTRPGRSCRASSPPHHSPSRASASTSCWDFPRPRGTRDRARGLKTKRFKAASALK